jgi:D-alanine-D-alanine ligase-like ATP-grasp enzyme
MRIPEYDRGSVYRFIKHRQEKGDRVCVMDMDCAFDYEVAAEAGIDLEELMCSQPENHEEAHKVAKVMKDNGFYLIGLHCPTRDPLFDQNYIV